MEMVFLHSCFKRVFISCLHSAHLFSGPCSQRNSCMLPLLLTLLPDLLLCCTSSSIATSSSQYHPLRRLWSSALLFAPLGLPGLMDNAYALVFIHNFQSPARFCQLSACAFSATVDIAAVGAVLQNLVPVLQKVHDNRLFLFLLVREGNKVRVLTVRSLKP